MKMKTSIIFACLLGASFAVPVYHQRYGFSASNSNEFMRHNGNAYNGVGYGQPQVPYMPPYVYQQQQPDMGVPSQLPLNPQVAGGAGQGPMQPQGPLPPQVLLPPQGPLPPQVLLPPQGPLPPQVLLPPQGPLPPQVLLPPQGPLPPQVLFPPSQKDQSPNAPQQPQQPNQMQPSYYPPVVFPQQTGGQGMPYYIGYGYPQPNQPAVWQPTQEQAQQHLEQPTQTSQQPLQESTAKQPPVIGTEAVFPTTAPGQLEGNIKTVTEETQPGLVLPFEP
ncbi:circumsporozoite protein-like [Polyodon spathula]|uniref:circumsporozoite protein-like n=1 Tax=Polyodon spathula TaxID=7913 RepID=UPI001B7DD5C0|nr:circumsporozoite protein-like [Polyodon spathula]